MAEQDFVVKKGLNVKNGDITITTGNLDLNNGYADIDNVKIDGNTISTTDTNGNLVLAPNGNGVVDIDAADIDGGAIDSTIIGANTAAAGTFTALAATSGDFANGVITNVGDIDADSISIADAASGLQIQFGGDTTTNKITLTDNLAEALTIEQGGNDYMKFVTTNSSENILIGKNTTVSALLNSTNSTNAISDVTGSIQTAGGLGVVKDIFVGDDIYLGSSGSKIWFGTSATGVLINNGGGYAQNTTGAMVTDGENPTINFRVGDTVRNTAGTLVGTITGVASTGGNAGTITMSAGTLVALVNNDALYATPASIEHRTGTDEGLLMSSANSAEMVLELKNTNADALATRLQFTKDGASPADDDKIGNILFRSEDSASNETDYANIVGRVGSRATQDEFGAIEMKVLTTSAADAVASITGLTVSGINQDPGKGIRVGVGGNEFTATPTTQSPIGSGVNLFQFPVITNADGIYNTAPEGGGTVTSYNVVPAINIGGGDTPHFFTAQGNSGGASRYTTNLYVQGTGYSEARIGQVVAQNNDNLHKGLGAALVIETCDDENFNGIFFSRDGTGQTTYSWGNFDTAESFSDMTWGIGLEPSVAASENRTLAFGYKANAYEDCVINTTDINPLSAGIAGGRVKMTLDENGKLSTGGHLDVLGGIAQLGSATVNGYLKLYSINNKTASGTLINNSGGYNASHTGAMVTDGTNASTSFSVGHTVYKIVAGALVTVGVVTGVSTTAITIGAGTATAVADNEILYKVTTNDYTTTLQGSSAVGASYTLTLPPDDGSTGQFLSTNGSGVLVWASETVGGIADSVMANDIATGDANVLIDSTSGSTIGITALAANLTLTTTSSGTLGLSGAAEVDITSAGLMDINAGANLDVDVTGTVDILASSGISIDGAAASNFSTSAGDITLDAAAASVNIDGGESDAAAVRLTASHSSGGIDIDSGTGGVAIDSTGALSIQGRLSSDITLQGTANTASELTIAAKNSDNDGVGHLILEAENNMIFTQAHVDGLFDINAVGALTVDTTDTTDGIKIGTSTSGVPIVIGHGTSETTFQDNVTITGNLTVNGDQTVINTTTIVAEDQSMVLGIVGGLVDATYARSLAVVTVTSNGHGISDNEYIFVSNAGNSITDNVYQIGNATTNTFTFTSPVSGAVSAGAVMKHSAGDTTEGTADGSGIYAPGTSLHSLQYDSSNGWLVSDDLDLASGKHLSVAGATTLTATTLGAAVVTSSLTTVGALASGTIASGFGTISTGNTITSTAAVEGGSLVADNITIDANSITSTNTNGNIALTPNGSGLVNIAKDDLAIAGTAVTTTATELNLLDTAVAGSVVDSKAVVYSAAGQVKANTLSVDAVAVLDTTANTNQSVNDTASIEIAQFDWGDYRTVKYVGHVSDGTDVDAFEVLVTWGGHATDAEDGAASIDMTTYAYISSGDAIGSLSTTVDGDNINLIFTNTSGANISSNFDWAVTATHLIKQ